MMIEGIQRAEKMKQIEIQGWMGVIFKDLVDMAVCKYFVFGNSQSLKDAFRGDPLIEVKSTVHIYKRIHGLT